MNTTILDIRPGLSGQLARAREALPADARRTLDEHVTQAERLVEDVFGGVPVWTLRGSDALWVRVTDSPAGVLTLTLRAARLLAHQAVRDRDSGAVDRLAVRAQRELDQAFRAARREVA